MVPLSDIFSDPDKPNKPPVLMSATFIALARGGRINAIYVAACFVGGLFGSIFSTIAWSLGMG